MSAQCDMLGDMARSKKKKAAKQVEGTTPVATEAPEGAEGEEEEGDDEGADDEGGDNPGVVDHGPFDTTDVLANGDGPVTGADLAPTFEGAATPERMDPETEGDNAGIPPEGEAHAAAIAATAQDAELVAKEPDAVEELPHRDPRCDANGRHIVNCDCTGSAREPL